MDNTRGALFMIFSMGCFAVEDALIKLVTDSIPVGQILAVTCLGGLAVFLTYFVVTGQRIWHKGYLDRRVIARSLSDVIGSCFFVTSLSLIPLTTASAVIQATPLVVGMGAAMFLGQSIGWRRWLAIAIGFVGVLIIIRPGLDGFSPYTLFAVAGMFCLAARDLLTRGLTISLSGPRLATHTFALIVPAGLLLMFIQGQSVVVPNAQQTMILAAIIAIGLIAYLAIVAATRGGNAGIISSFRYSRMIFALIIGFLLLGEVPDTATIIGATVIIATGLFTLWREAKAARA